MGEVEAVSLDDTLRSLNHALEESRRLRENLQYLPPDKGLLWPSPLESAEDVEELLPVST